MGRLHAVMLSLAVVSCVAPTDERPVDGPAVGLNVIGNVRDAQGAPIAGAALEVRARHPVTCTGGFAVDRVASDSAGTFSSALFAWNTPREVCVWIAIVPPTESEARADTVTHRPARLETAPGTLEVLIGLRPPAD